MTKNDFQTEIKQHKQIAFDLGIALLKEHYPKPEGSINAQFYTAAYNDIRRFMEKNGFKHAQGSVYDSVEELSYTMIQHLMDKMAKELSWLHLCVKTIAVTDIITQKYDLTEYLRSVSQQKENEITLDFDIPQPKEEKKQEAPIQQELSLARETIGSKLSFETLLQNAEQKRNMLSEKQKDRQQMRHKKCISNEPER